MNYPKYEYVLAVARAQSISKAAAELYISQPALTKFISKLEQDLGVKLFNRRTTPITLTLAGERFVEHARKILDIQSSLDKELEDISTMRKGRLSIGISAVRGEIWLPFILPIFSKKYPNIELRVVEGDFSHLENLIEQETIDIILIATPLDSDKLDYTVLMEERIFLAVSEKNRLLKDADLSRNSLDNPYFIPPQMLDGQNMVCLSRGMGIRRIVDSICQLHDIRPNIVLETQSADTAYKLALADIGVSFVSESCIISNFPSYLPALCTITRTPLSRKSVACCRKDAYLPIAARTFIKELKGLLRSGCPNFTPPTQEQFESARRDIARRSPVTDWINNILETAAPKQM